MQGNPLDQIRRHLGLSKPIFLRLIGAQPRHFWLLARSAERIDYVWLRRAKDLADLYAEWREEILDTARRHDGLTVSQLALALDTYMSYLSGAQEQEVLRPTPEDHAKLSVEDIQDMFAKSETYLDQAAPVRQEPRSGGVPGRRMSSPIARTFVRWLLRSHPEYLRLSSGETYETLVRQQATSSPTGEA